MAAPLRAQAVALAFARVGADVVVAYLSEHPDAAGTVRLVEEAGRRAIPFAGDLRDEDACRDLVSLARRKLGGVDTTLRSSGGVIASMTSPPRSGTRRSRPTSSGHA